MIIRHQAPYDDTGQTIAVNQGAAAQHNDTTAVAATYMDTGQATIIMQAAETC